MHGDDTDRTIPSVVGWGFGTAVVLATFHYTGGLMGPPPDRDVDVVARKEFLRKNRRTNIEETINQLGEGRGKLACLESIHSQEWEMNGHR